MLTTSFMTSVIVLWCRWQTKYIMFIAMSFHPLQLKRLFVLRRMPLGRIMMIRCIDKSSWTNIRLRRRNKMFQPANYQQEHWCRFHIVYYVVHDVSDCLMIPLTNESYDFYSCELPPRTTQKDYLCYIVYPLDVLWWSWDSGDNSPLWIRTSAARGATGNRLPLLLLVFRM